MVCIFNCSKNGMVAQKITLVFPSLNQLWNFVREVRINYSNFDPVEITLECNCTKADVEMAIEKFDAKTR